MVEARNNETAARLLPKYIQMVSKQHKITVQNWGKKRNNNNNTNKSTRITTCDRRVSLYVPISLKASVNLVITGPKKKKKKTN